MSLPIAYRMSKRSRGGMCAHGGELGSCEHCDAEMMSKGGDAGIDRETGYEKGIHTRNGSAQKPGTGDMSSRNRQTQYSGAGHSSREATRTGNPKDKERAIFHHEEVLDQMRAMPSPKLKAEGGEMTDDDMDMVDRIMCKRMSKGGWTPERGKKQHEELQAKRGESYGDETKGVHSPSYSSGRDRGQSMAGDLVRYAPSHRKGEYSSIVKGLHREKLSELKSDKQDRKYLSEGGRVGDRKRRHNFEEGIHRYPGAYEKVNDTGMGMPPSVRQKIAHEVLMEGLKKTNPKLMSEGGMIANEDLPEADSMPDEFDDLALRDDLESSYTGENSGDFEGCEDEDERRRDMVSRIMRSRGKKDRNPRPA